MRQIRRNPGFAAVIILLLAVGIGAATAVFGLVRGVILRPLPYSYADRLVVVWEDLVRDGNHTYSVAPLNAHDIRDRSGAFSDVAFQLTGGGLTLRNAGPTEMIRPGLVSGNFFDVIGARAVLGRVLTAEDERTRARVVVLSNALWRERFGGSASVVGSTVTLDDEPYTVVGVMGADFESPWVFKAPHMLAALWTPLSIPAGAEDRTSAMLQVIGRLRPGVSATDAQSRMTLLAGDLSRSHPATNTGIGFNVVPVREQIIGRIRTPLLLLLGSIAFLLVIACANLTSLLLQRALGRRHELAVRVALGAGRGQIVRQLVTENTVLAMAGGVCGALLGWYGTRLLVALAPSDTPRLTGVHADSGVFAFAAGITILVAAALSLAPALRASAGIGSVLRSARSAPRDVLRSGFAGMQVALAVVLVVAGTLFVRSFGRLTAVDTGFITHDVASLRVALPDARYAEPARQAAFFEALVDRLENTPGVISAGLTSRPPLDPPYGYTHVDVVGAEAATVAQDLTGFRVVTPDYLKTLDVPLRAGRMLQKSDAGRSPSVAVVNAALAARYFPATSPIHRRLTLGGSGGAAVEIVGVVGDMSNGSFDAAPIPEIFVPLAQNPVSAATLLVHTAAGAGDMRKIIQTTVAELDPMVATQESRSMDEIAATNVALPRFSAFLVGTFATLALLLAAIGVYGVFAQAVSARTREIGIRAALGASFHRILLPILAEGALVMAGGIIAGVALSLLLGRIMQSQLFGIAARDGSTILLACGTMATVGLLSCTMPAWRALKMNPAVALRSDS